jgi:hypothetical protein
VIDELRASSAYWPGRPRPPCGRSPHGKTSQRTDARGGPIAPARRGASPSATRGPPPGTASAASGPRRPGSSRLDGGPDATPAFPSGAAHPDLQAAASAAGSSTPALLPPRASGHGAPAFAVGNAPPSQQAAHLLRSADPLFASSVRRRPASAGSRSELGVLSGAAEGEPAAARPPRRVGIEGHHVSFRGDTWRSVQVRSTAKPPAMSLHAAEAPPRTGPRQDGAGMAARWILAVVAAFGRAPRGGRLQWAQHRPPR